MEVYLLLGEFVGSAFNPYQHQKAIAFICCCTMLIERWDNLATENLHLPSSSSAAEVGAFSTSPREMRYFVLSKIGYIFLSKSICIANLCLSGLRANMPHSRRRVDPSLLSRLGILPMPPQEWWIAAHFTCLVSSYLHVHQQDDICNLLFSDGAPWSSCRWYHRNRLQLSSLRHEQHNLFPIVRTGIVSI